MTTRQRLENIIIGTLLDIENHWDDVNGYVTEEMFSDDTNRQIFRLIVQMRNEGHRQTDPSSIFDRFGEQVVGMVSRMCELCNDFSFEAMKVRYNELRYVYDLRYGTDHPATNIEFVEYVKHFINCVIEDEKKRNQYEHAADAAA